MTTIWCPYDTMIQWIETGGVVHPNLQSRSRHLSHGQEEQRDGIDLEMAPLVIANNLEREKDSDGDKPIQIFVISWHYVG